eukprot:CAMPEP_0172426172 /NCGR_PEP_ID=MMETSP1064-20121228/36092_1 /TAXON_ID=202472 /ORGANISM="Aulacoseira subarctica , Strain CCAP 1002/5" /LENGTH=70 /DNA_ID=CAMNT_0013169595 /DNA_START=112 /DNA_END=324 /DNA_ORIENTATION=+
MGFALFMGQNRQSAIVKVAPKNQYEVESVVLTGANISCAAMKNVAKLLKKVVNVEGMEPSAVPKAAAYML